MSASQQRLDIQGLRAVAVLAVVLFHAGLPLPGGFSGVDVFFVISGFVIVAMLLRQASSGQGVQLRNFYGRRFRRLMPALAVMVAFTVIVGMFLLSPFGPQQALAWTALGAVLLTANVAIFATSGGYFDPAAETNPLLNTWSLSVEEQFYLIFPAVFIGVIWLSQFRRRRDRQPGQVSHRPLALVIALVTVASFALAVAANNLDLIAGNEIVTGFYSPLTRAWEFGLGALLAVATARGRTTPRAARLPLSILGAGLMITGFLVLDDQVRYPGILTLLPTLGAALVIAAGPGEFGPVHWVLTRRWIVNVGDWSYSIYLWHWPIIVFAVLLFPGMWWVPAAAAIVSLLPALIAYRWVENPLRSRPWGSPSRTAIRAGLVLGIPVLLAGLLLAGANVRWGNHEARTLLATPAANHVGFVDCMSFLAMGGGPALRPEVCYFDWQDGQPPLYLVGDSNAAQFSEGVVGAAKLLRRPAQISAAAGCPYFDVYRYSARYSDGANTACRAYYQDTLAALQQSKPGVVFIGSSIGYWVDPTMVLGRTSMPGRGSVGPTPDEATAGLVRAVETLRQSGHQVVVVLPSVTFPGQRVSVDQCPTVELFLGTCPFALSVNEVATDQLVARQQIDAAVTGAGGIVVDLLDRQCPEGQCSAIVDNIPLYSDATHYSPEFSASLVGLFAEAALLSER